MLLVIDHQFPRPLWSATDLYYNRSMLASVWINNWSMLISSGYNLQAKLTFDCEYDQKYFDNLGSIANRMQLKSEIFLNNVKIL